MNDPRKVLVTAEQFLVMLDNPDTEAVCQYEWRYGHRETVKVMHDGKPYVATYDVHSDEGIQLYGSVVLWPAAQKTVTVWVRDEEPGK